MLVLARKNSEMIQIGDSVVVKVIRTGRNCVKIGIEAPSNVRVLRAELCGPMDASHPLAAFLNERRAIRTGQPVDVTQPATVTSAVVRS